MFALVLIACLKAAPDHCHDVKLEADSMFQCVMQGAQIPVEKWLAEHPEYEVRKYRCRIGPPEGDPA